MSKIYTIAFRMGVLFNVVLWTIFNILSFKFAEAESLRANPDGLDFGIHFGFRWGLPLPMFRNYWLTEPQYLVLNTLVYVVCGFFFGFLFKFVWSKISRRGFGLNATPSA